jgi:hypothetical protein
MQKLRIVTFGVSGGRSLTRPFRDIPLCGIVARTRVYTYAAKVWELSIVQGPFFCRPVPNLKLRFATFSSLYVAHLIVGVPLHLLTS